jgi:DNA-binding NarL/FixJ family response regulator/PAS domain-containing protein
MLANIFKRWPTSFGIGTDSASQPLLLLVLTAAIPILLFGLWASHLSAENGRANIRRDILERVEDVTERVSAELRGHLGMLQGLAASTALDRDDLGLFYIEALRLKAANPLWYTVELADPSGAQVLNLLRPLGQKLGPTVERASFDKVVQTRQPAVSGIGPIGPVSGLQLVALRVPVIRGEELRYVLSVAFEPKSISWILSESGVPPGWIGGVLDARGNVVARTLDEGYTIGGPASEISREVVERAPGGFYRGRTLEGVEVETAYQLLPHTDGWSVHFGISSELLNAPVEKSQYFLSGGGVLSLVLAGILSILVSRDMAQRRRDEQTRATLMLRASEEHRIMALEAAALGTWRWNAELDRLEVSTRTAELLELSRQSPAGEIAAWRYEDLLDAIHPDDRLRLDEAVQQCLRADRPVEVEFRTVRKDESIHWVRLIGRCQRIEEDGPKFLQGVIADIDHRKQADARHNALLRRLAQAQEDERRHIALCTGSGSTKSAEVGQMTDIRVAVADDHPVVLAGIKALLQAAPEITLVGDATTGKAAIELIQQALPDIAIIDISLPDISGLDIARCIAETCPAVKLLALTVHEDRAYVQLLLQAGVRGYILKRSAAEDLVRAIRAVAAGGIFLDPEIADKALAETAQNGSSSSDKEHLSQREKEVLRLTAQGFSNKEIAARLDVSIKTVETYKARASEKLNLRTRVDIVRYGVAHGWLESL